MLYRVQSTALGQSGLSLQLLPGATVTVYDKTGALATIYSDSAGVTMTPNPAIADASGGYDLYVTIDDFYDLSVSANGQTVDERIYPFSLELALQNWRDESSVRTFAEVELWPTKYQDGAQYIVVNDGGYYVAYERDATGASTDLTTIYGEAFIKRGVNAADFATLANDLAATLGPVYTTNANGSSVKFPDGTMICTKVLTGNGPISTALGSLFASSAVAIGTLPATFVGVPIRRTMIASGTGASAWYQDVTPPTTTDGGSVQLLRATTSALTTYEVHCIFTGRWS